MTHDSAAAVVAPAPEHVLAFRALGGDVEAEREVCRRLLPAIRAFASRRLRPSSAEDFAQDALLLLVEAIRERRVDDPRRLASFALGICRNLARERARSGERRAALMAAFGLTEADLTTFTPPSDVRREHLEDCYSQLTERSRAVIKRTFVEDDDDVEIASMLGLTAANVRVIRHRTLTALRTCLERPISWVGR
jgi:RNA polymerase sigma-70 factor, ECF subfamily